MATHSNGMSARQLEDQLGVTYKTAWLLTQKLRRSMVDPDREPLEGVVEVDQAEIPFREGDAFFEPGNAGKILVIGAVEVIDRDVNQARPRRKHAKYLDTRSGRTSLAMIANNSAKSIEAFVKANVKRGTTPMTHGHASYPGLAGYRHDPRIVGKMAGHIVLPWIHRAFSLMKRWSLGTYHGLRRKHVDTYLNEFVFRYNRRFHRHVSFEALLGLAAHYEPASYWDIVKRDNPRKRAETLRRAPRRSKTATGRRQDAAPPAQGVRRDQPMMSPSPRFRSTWCPGGSAIATWKTFLRNHAEGIASIDLFVVPTIAFEQLYALLVLRHRRRRLLWTAVTRSPTAEWLARQITEAFPWDSAPKYLIRDHDRAFVTGIFRARVRAMGIRDRPTSFRAP